MIACSLRVAKTTGVHVLVGTQHVATRLGVSLAEITGGLAELGALWRMRRPSEIITFVTCTDGNHGQAVAWAAKHLGHRAIVLMPKGSAEARVERVRAQGGQCSVTELNYDATVALAGAQAAEHGWTLLQDTTMPGYVDIPSRIMQGYTAMVDEALEQWAAWVAGGAGGAAWGCTTGDAAPLMPTHVVLQVGVGSMAAAVLSYLVEEAAERAAARGGQGRGAAARPIVLTLEPETAACAFESAKRADGEMAIVEGDLETMIAGLACGVPSDLAWPILWEHVST